MVYSRGVAKDRTIGKSMKQPMTIYSDFER